MAARHRRPRRNPDMKETGRVHSEFDVGQVLAQVHAWSRERGYKGYNKHDGLNSPLLNRVAGWGKWPRIFAIQSVMRAPFNPRPLIGVPATYNPKGLALFAQSWLDRYAVTGDRQHLDEAVSLLQLLQTLAVRDGHSGLGWGYHYPWQDPGFFAPAGTPNAVVTAFVCEAFLDGHAATGRVDFLESAEAAIPFFLNDLRVLKDTDDELCLSYMPVGMTMRVMDVSILIGSVLARHGAASGCTDHLTIARRLVNYVVRRQTDYGAWYYTDPPDASRITHDNYHTGFILDALSRYMQASGEREWAECYDRGLVFYRDNLFTAAGAPKWMHDREFPYDIHGAAQGILTFSRHPEQGDGLADRILRWTLANMYRPEGRFIYQVTRWYPKRFTLMRWCNAWMCRALARFLACSGTREPKQAAR